MLAVLQHQPRGSPQQNHGVDPDYVVEQDAKAVRDGHEPQLENALALDELKEHPPTAVNKPACPLYTNAW